MRIYSKFRYTLIKGFVIFFMSSISLVSCRNDYLELTPVGSLNPDVLQNLEALDATLIGTYAALDGRTDGPANIGWASSHDNWLYGDVSSDNALKGSSISDQPDMNAFELWGTLEPNNSYLEAAWTSIYEGVARANGVLSILANTEGLDSSDFNRIAGEARFLRAHFYHLGRRYFNRLPYVDENVEDFAIPNDKDIFEDIEADYLFAIENLPVEPFQLARAHVNAARAGLAKLYMDEGRYADAKPLLDAIISSGRYILHDEFTDNFTIEFETQSTNKEAIFQMASSLRDVGNPWNGNWGRLLVGIAQIHGCCGFMQPSQNLVNAYKTDSNGLPLLDTFNDVDLANDDGINSDEPFTPPTDNLDPRLDHTVGRRGIPYLDHGIFPGRDWIVDPTTYGPYRAKKMLATAEEHERNNGSEAGMTTVNYSFHRYADILLLRAEVAVEEGDLGTALDYVNMIRNRAKNSTPVQFDDGTPAANYVIEPYPAFPDQDFARKAVRFERRLELALEGHRWYDLIRWGIAREVMEDYFSSEGQKRPLIASSAGYKSDYLPIPENQILITLDEDGNQVLTQNPDY